MALISAYTVIRGLVLFHLTISYLLLTSPTWLLCHPSMKIFGESMGFAPMSPEILKACPAPTAFAGLLFAFLGFTDLVAVTSGKASREHWDVQAPSRGTAFMLLAAYTYVFKPRRSSRFKPMSVEEESLAGIRTGTVFTWAFFEMLVWFWVYVKLREERRDAQLRLAQQMAEKQRMEIDGLS